MTYNPKPIDTSKIEIPESLEELTEKIAEHIHDVWACKRIAEGWSYGPARNDEDKKHPDLVHYSELTESEKDYDRATAIETIKAIIALGYGIKKK
jgi:hypothetical protein